MSVSQGAWLNYHYIFFFLAAVPASLALAQILHDAWAGKLLPLSMLLGYSLCAMLFLFQSLLFPLALARSTYLDYQTVAKTIREDFPAGSIYANNSEAIYLHDRVLFAPWSEGIMGYTPSLSGSLKRLQSALKHHTYVAAVFQSSDCKNWQPNGILEAHLSRLTKFHKAVGNFCIYTTPAHPSARPGITSTPP